MNDLLAALLAEQAGMLARRQLTAHGLDWDHVNAQVRARRWVVRTPRVISTTTGPMDLAQRRWLGVLHAGPRSVLGGLSAAEALGLTGWEREVVTVWVDDELALSRCRGCGSSAHDAPSTCSVVPELALPVAHLETAVLLAAAYELQPRAAHGLLAAAVQQRLTTAPRLLTWVDQLRPLRRAKSVRAALGDIADGSHSRAELVLVDLCRRRSLPVPDRQRPRIDERGRARWTDAEWDRADGTTLVLEVDGAFHMEAGAWGRDKRRQRRIVAPGRTVVGCTATELREEPEELVSDLRSLGVESSRPDSCA